MDAPPLFSVAVPAYKDATLLRSALASTLSQSVSNLEVIVSDDSDSEELRAVVAAAADPRVRYVARRAPSGAVANWNFCLEQSRGRYTILLHHDERFAHADCLRAVEGVFRDTGASVVVSALSLETGAVVRPFGLFRRLVRRLSARLSARLPLIYNAVGPASVLALDADARAVRFDEGLSWLVDVEYYARLFRGRRVRLCGGSRLISRLGHPHKISDAMDTARAEAEERSAILRREPSAAVRALLRAGWTGYDAARRLKSQAARPR